MTKVKENHFLTGKFEEMRTIRPGQLSRGCVLLYFGKDTPDRKGKYGYGFLKSESGERLFFCMPHLYGVEVSKELPESRLLFVMHHHLEKPLEEPKVGDVVLYFIRERGCGCAGETRWVFERDYLAAEQELAEKLANA